MKKSRNIFAVLICVCMVSVLQACAVSTQLIPRLVDPAEIKGTFTLILYGCRYADDLENMAILVDEKNEHTFELYAMDSMFKVKKGLSGQQAVNEAKTFISCSMQPVLHPVMRRIPDDRDETIGYEVKPLYRDISPSEVLLSFYSLEEGKVTAYISLDPSVNRGTAFREHLMKLRSY